MRHLWGYDYDAGSNVVDVYIRYLGKKRRENRISTVHGTGYRLEEIGGWA